MQMQIAQCEEENSEYDSRVQNQNLPFIPPPAFLFFFFFFFFFFTLVNHVKKGFVSIT